MAARVFLLFALVLMISPAAAQEQETGRWEGSATLGLSFVRSNRNTDSLDLLAGAKNETRSSRILLGAGYLFSRQSGVTNTETWFVNGDYNFSRQNRVYGYLNGRLRQDRIQNLDLRTILGAGVGYEWIRQPDLNVRVEGGLSWLQEDFSNAGSRSDLNVQLAYLLDKKLWQGARLRHDLTYYPRLSDLNDYYLLAQFVIEQAISSKWSVNATVILDYDATPAPDTRRSTSKVLIGLSAKF